MKKKTTATIYDVAKRAKVSPSTVSFVYNRSNSFQRIPLATRERVTKAIKELNYRPNAGARSMVLKRYETLGLLFTGDFTSLGRHMFYRDMLDGIELACAEIDYLSITAKSSLQQQVPKFLRSPCVDGMLAVHALPDACRHEIALLELPVLCVNTPAEGFPYIKVDDHGSTRLALENLWAMGHRNIGYVTSSYNSDHCSRIDRIATYRQFIAERGIPEVAYVPCNKDVQIGDEFKTWLKATLEQTNTKTFICYAGDVAREMMAAIQEMNLNLSDFTVVSLSDIELPPEKDDRTYSGIVHHTFDLGYMAAKMLDHLLHNVPIPPVTNIMGEWRTPVARNRQ